jgi:hypothetical protein
MNNIVVLDSKQLFLMKYVLITILPIIQKRIRIEMKSINTDA